jgi:hypothetical protein
MKNKFLFWSILVLSLISLVHPQSLRAQGPDPEALRGIVQTYLVEQLGREATLLEFSFVGVTWEDTGLECAPEGVETEAADIVGYRWSFLMDDGIRYSLHSNIDTSQIVLCADTSERVFTYSTYSSNLFSINHPNLWSARQESPNQFSFTFRGQGACNLPDMGITAVANVADAASLLDDFLANRGIDSGAASYAPAAETGLSTSYTAECNGLLRRWRVTALPGNGGSFFLILQSAPVNVFGIWRPAFAEMVDSFAPGSGLVSGGATGFAASTATSVPPTPQATQATVEAVAAPTESPTATPLPTVPQPPPAPELDLTTIPLGLVFLGDVHVGRLNDLPGISASIGGDASRQHLRMSSDGLQMAYIEDETRLFTLPLNDPRSPNPLRDDAAPNFPPSWSLEGAALSYAAELDVDDDQRELEIRMIFPDGSEQTAGPISVAANCEMESDYRVDRLFAQEAGGMAFVWLPGDRFLFSQACDGGELAIIDAESGEISELEPSLTGAQLAPDRMQLAAVHEEAIVIVDLMSLQSESVPATRPPDQLTWDITGTQVIYSSIFPQEPVIWTDDTTEADSLEVLGAFPFESRLNTLSLFQVDTVNGLEAQLWEGTGFAIGKIAGAPDGSGIVFSLIPSDRSLLTNFANGAEQVVIRNSVPETELYWLPISFAPDAERANPQLVAIAGQPIFAPPAAAFPPQ